MDEVVPKLGLEVVTITVALAPGLRPVTVSGRAEALGNPALTDPADVLGVKV